MPSPVEDGCRRVVLDGAAPEPAAQGAEPLEVFAMSVTTRHPQYQAYLDSGQNLRSILAIPL